MSGFIIGWLAGVLVAGAIGLRFTYLAERERNDARAINRLNGEAVQYWQYIASRIRTLCSKRKDSTAIAVMKMIGDGK